MDSTLFIMVLFIFIQTLLEMLVTVSIVLLIIDQTVPGCSVAVVTGQLLCADIAGGQ